MTKVIGRYLRRLLGTPVQEPVLPVFRAPPTIPPSLRTCPAGIMLTGRRWTPKNPDAINLHSDGTECEHR